MRCYSRVLDPLVSGLTWDLVGHLPFLGFSLPLRRLNSLDGRGRFKNSWLYGICCHCLLKFISDWKGSLLTVLSSVGPQATAYTQVCTWTNKTVTALVTIILCYWWVTDQEVWTKALVWNQSVHDYISWICIFLLPFGGLECKDQPLFPYIRHCGNVFTMIFYSVKWDLGAMSHSRTHCLCHLFGPVQNWLLNNSAIQIFLQNWPVNFENKSSFPWIWVSVVILGMSGLPYWKILTSKQDLKDIEVEDRT